MTHPDPRFEPTKLREAKALKTAKAQLDESARMIARQKVLLEEAEPDNIVRVELQRSMIRLEACYEASRVALEAARMLVDATAGGVHDVAPTSLIAEQLEEIPRQPIRSSRPQPSWFRTSKRVN